MSLTTEQARETMDAFLEAEGVVDHGSARRDIAADRLFADIEAADERDADDLDRVPAWFLREPFAAARYAIYAIGFVAYVVIAWLTH